VTEKDIIQSSKDLKLCLSKKGPSVVSDLSVYHEQKKWSACIYIIGESHAVCFENFSEILACKKSLNFSDIELFDKILFVGKQEQIKHFEVISLGVGASVDYKFSFKKIEFGDRDYIKEWKGILEEVNFKISYNFTTNEKDNFKETIINDAVTLVGIRRLSNGYKWKSVHVYPDEELGVFTETVLSTIKK